MNSQSPSPLHVGRPNIGNREAFLERVNEMLDSKWFSNDGPFVREFEAAVATFLGVKHCIAVCNATIGLGIAAQALKLTGEVILPSYTFIASAHALQLQGITPIFVDIDPCTHNLDPAKLEKLITRKTSAILGVHLWGRPCNVEEIATIAARHNIPTMYDAAHAFGCSYRGTRVGGNGACEVFSFHATKFLNSFEGGAITTNDDALADRMRLLRNFGFSGLDTVTALGTNAKMPEVCAAMGITSLEAISDLIEINKQNYHAYDTAMSSLHGCSLVEYDKTQDNNYQYIVAELCPSYFDRDKTIAKLHSKNIYARKYFWPGCHRMEPYKSTCPDAAQRLSHTELISERVIVLPTGQATTNADIDRVCQILKSCQRRTTLSQQTDTAQVQHPQTTLAKRDT
ncbi:DegT/DnrJ/EryC1/StrS family aminotransferase [Rhodopirellula europaea]|uniref:DegT/DnrJ/EryC1/StrS family aminotransferase n=1 Tax=Rhodopirellula europaea TaxID=1263866 RepID=UPI003D27E16E